MEFSWNETKRKENLSKHGIDFIDMHEMFKGPMLVRLDTREDYGEDRWLGVGYIQNRVVVACYIERDEGEQIHLISARKALRHECKFFEKEIAKQLG